VLFFRRDSSQRIPNTITTIRTTMAMRRIMAATMAQVGPQVDEQAVDIARSLPGEYRAPFKDGSARGDRHHHALGKRVSATRARP
jgi:hypothetical protein